MDELLALVGGSWRPLLLYPGVLTGIGATLLMGLLWTIPGTRPRWPAWRPAHTPDLLFGAGCGLLLLALLPFPRSYWAYPIDIFVALALLEVPHWLRLVRRLNTGDDAIQIGAATEAGALLNVYVLLALAVAVLGQAAGSLLLPDLVGARPPLRWVGLVAWAVAMPPLLAFGPWRVAGSRDWLVDLRRVAHIALLVALALPAGDEWDYGVTAIAAGLGFGSLTLLHHLWRGRPERWERLQPVVVLLLLAVLLYTSAQAWIARLR